MCTPRAGRGFFSSSPLQSKMIHSISGLSDGGKGGRLAFPPYLLSLPPSLNKGEDKLFFFSLFFGFSKAFLRKARCPPPLPLSRRRFPSSPFPPQLFDAVCSFFGSPRVFSVEIGRDSGFFSSFFFSPPLLASQRVDSFLSFFRFARGLLCAFFFKPRGVIPRLSENG